MDSWLLRPVFARKQTSTPVPRPASTTALDLDSDDKYQTTSRATSYLSFRASTASVPPTPTVDEASGVFPNLRSPENLWTKPSSDQMVELLKVVMMNQSAMDSVPVRYNSCILHVLEAYYELKMQMEAKDGEIENLKRTYAKDVMDFEKLGLGWQKREKEFQQEIKRLEILLSKTEGGLESVTLAREKSVLQDRKGESERIRRSVGTIKDRLVQRLSGDLEDTKGLARARRDDQFLQTLPRQPPTEQYVTEVLQSPAAQSDIRQSDSRQLADKDSSAESTRDPNPVKDTAPLSQATKSFRNIDVPSSKRQLRIITKEVYFDSSANSSAISDSSIEDDNLPTIYSRRHSQRGVGSPNKPLPDLPDLPVAESELPEPEIPNLESSHSEHLNTSPNAAAKPELVRRPTLSFSFQPGDDNPLQAVKEEGDELPRNIMSKHVGSTTLTALPTPPSSNDASVPRPPSKRSSTRSGKVAQLARDLDSTVHHSNSSSSILTAIRDGSVSRGNSGSATPVEGRPKTERQVSKDAVEAASTALREDRKRGRDEKGKS